MEKLDSANISAMLRNITDLSVDTAIDSIGGSEPMYEKLLGKVIDLLPANIENMDKFLKESSDLNDFAIRAHGVKGSLRQVGCLRLADAAESLEKAAKAADRQYCDMNYGVFKEELVQFCEKVSSVLKTTETSAEPQGAPGNINDYIDTLVLIKEAAAGYDTSLAAQNLAPLLKFKFGGDVDILLKKAQGELALYHPRKASVYITEILDKCH